MNDAINELRGVVAARRDAEANASQQMLQDASRQRLSRIVEGKLRTSFIGAMSQFERFFGYMWGHGKDASHCSSEELACRDVWSRCRTEVLRNGNNQIRAVQTELTQYDIAWNLYHMMLPARRRQE